MQTTPDWPPYRGQICFGFLHTSAHMAVYFVQHQIKVETKDDDAQRVALIRLAKQHGQYGNRKVGERLRIEGWRMDHIGAGKANDPVNRLHGGRVKGLWHEEGQQQPNRHKKRKRLYRHDASVIRLRPHFPNHIWSIDFVHEKLSNGRPYKMLNQAKMAGQGQDLPISRNCVWQEGSKIPVFPSLSPPPLNQIRSRRMDEFSRSRP